MFFFWGGGLAICYQIMIGPGGRNTYPIQDAGPLRKQVVDAAKLLRCLVLRKSMETPHFVGFLGVVGIL